jgi:hypothetical protein
MLVNHPLVAAESVGVTRRTTEDLAPPDRNMAAVVLMHATGKERRQRIIRFNPVIEGVDHPVEHRLPAGPLEQRRIVTGHRRTVVLRSIADDPDRVGDAESGAAASCGSDARVATF